MNTSAIDWGPDEVTDQAQTVPGGVWTHAKDAYCVLVESEGGKGGLFTRG